MKQFKTKAITKKGEFDVIVTVDEKISAIQGVAFWDYSAEVIIDNCSFAARIERAKNDRIYAEPELCERWGIKYNSNIALSCDVSEAINYVRNIQKKRIVVMNEIEESETMFNKLHNL